MKKGMRRVGRTVAVAAIVAALGVLLFPVFSTPSRLPYGLLLNAERKPMAGATIRFRDVRTGTVVASFTADSSGRFAWKRLGEPEFHSTIQPEGYLAVEGHPSTGGPRGTVFSPLGQHRAAWKDERGRPLANLPVEMRAQADWRRDPVLFSGRTDARGCIIVRDMPLMIRDVEFVSRDRRRVVTNVTRTASGATVSYQVAALPGATIAGRVMMADGRPARGFIVFAYTQSAAGRPIYPYRLAWVGPLGKFQVDGLTPGRYMVGARRRQEMRALAGRPVRLAAGETKTGVELRLLTANASPFRAE